MTFDSETSSSATSSSETSVDSPVDSPLEETATGRAASTVFCCGSTSASPKSLIASCPAKLNIFLEVCGKREDGFHELETVMLRTSLCDQLTIRPASGTNLSLRFSDATPVDLRAGVPLDDSNLILRAAKLVQSQMGSPIGAEFILHKRIPPQSGLGGGSSNAATALLLSRKFWKAALTDSDLHMMAASLGSDINFLLSGYSAALCRGRGEQIQEICLGRDLHFVALRPSQGNSTADVFRRTQLSTDLRNTDQLIKQLAQRERGDLQPLMFNRLTQAARDLNGQMDHLMSRLQAVLHRPILMSGSGSTVFVTAQSAADADLLQMQIRTRLKMSSWKLDVSHRNIQY